MHQLNTASLSLSSKSSNKNRSIPWPEAPALKQQFSLPDSIIYYITKIPSKPEVYLKLTQSCKYFFAKNPILVVARIHKDERFCSKDECEKEKCCVKFNISKLSCKIWLTNNICLSKIKIPTFAPFFVPKIYRCENVIFHLLTETMLLKDFQLFASKFQNYILSGANVINNDRSPVILEKILECIPLVKFFYYYFEKGNPAATSSTMKNIIKLQNLGNLHKLVLFNIPDIINVKDLDELIKNHKNTKFWLDFSQRISEKYTNQLDQLIDTVISSEALNRVINYRRQDKGKLEIMQSRYTP